MAKQTTGRARFGIQCPIARHERVEKSKTLKVFGFASVATAADGTPVVDAEGDEITVDDLEDAAYRFAKSAARAANVYAHGTPPTNPVIESVVLTPEKRQAMGLGPGPSAWWVGIEVSDPQVIADVESGRLAAFSIEGSAYREVVQ